MIWPNRGAGYAAVLGQRYVLRTFGAALVGRLSYGIVSVALVVALSQATGSYAWAGVAMACFGAGASFLAPARARLIDRHGPARVLPVLALSYGAVLGVLVVAAWGPGTPRPVLLALTLAAGACSPPLGPVMRVLWSDLLPDAGLRQRAFALDTVVEELLYVVGPVIAGAFIAAGVPALGVAASAVLVVAGTTALCASPAVRDRKPRGAARTGDGASTALDAGPDHRDGPDAAAAGPAGRAVAGGSREAEAPDRPEEPREPQEPGGPAGWLPPAVAAGALGVSLGALELLVVAFARDRHDLPAVAWIQAALSVGSAFGGFVYGARTWRTPALRRLALLAAAVSLPLVLSGLATNVYVLAAAAGCAGLFVAPALSTAYLVADERATDETRTRAGTWVNSAFNAGSAAGTTAAGLLLGPLPLWLCLAATALPTLAAAPAVLARRGAAVVGRDAEATG